MIDKAQGGSSPYVTRQDLHKTEEQIKRKWKIVLTLLALAVHVTPSVDVEENEPTGEKDTPPAVKVLVIDNDPASSDELTTALQVAGFQVIPASSPEIGFSKLKDVSLVILDEALSGVSEICSRIRDQSEMPIILLGSEPDAKAWNQAVLLGADAYLRRAVSRRELIARIRAILRRYPNVSLPGGF